MGIHIVAEAVLRVEHKIDSLLKHFKIQPPPMQFTGAACPSCMLPVDYYIDVQHQVVVRRCACSTGKIPLTFLLPTTLGTTNAKDQLVKEEGAVPSTSTPDSDIRPRRNTKPGGGGQVR